MFTTIDFDTITRNIFDRISIMFGIEEEENKHIYSKKFKKIYYWIGYTGIPAFLGFVSIILMFYIFFRAYNRFGFERTMITLMILVVISLRGLKPKPKI